MAAIEWKNEYSVGNAAVDADHQAIVRLINRLCEAQERGADRIVMDEIFADLVAYTASHFAREEALMEMHDFTRDRLLEQRSEHTILTNQLLEIRGSFQAGTPSAVIAAELRDFTTIWFIGHILEEDMKFRDFMAGAAANGA